MDLYDCVPGERYLIRGYTLKNNKTEWYFNLSFNQFVDEEEIFECKIPTEFHEIVGENIKYICEEMISFDCIDFGFYAFQHSDEDFEISIWPSNYK